MAVIPEDPVREENSVDEEYFKSLRGSREICEDEEDLLAQNNTILPDHHHIQPKRITSLLQLTQDDFSENSKLPTVHEVSQTLCAIRESILNVPNLTPKEKLVREIFLSEQMA